MDLRQTLVVVVVVMVGDGSAWWPFYDAPSQKLCRMCQCPADLVMAQQEIVDCVGRNITKLEDGLEIPEGFRLISFARNHIRTLSSSTFNPSSSLFSLDIAENDLDGLPENTFTPLEELTCLNLRNNNISTVDPKAFAGLHNLTQLDISYNNIRTLAREVFEDLSSLEKLYIGFNPMGTLDESFLDYTPALEILDMSHLDLKVIPPDFLNANLSKLKSLSLAHNKLHMVPALALHHLSSSLQHLDLSGNQFTSLDAFSFDGLRNLRSLVLEQLFKLRTIDIYAFGDLTRLESLVMRYMPWIEKIHPKAFYYAENGKEFALKLSDFTFSYSSLHTLPEDLLPWDDLRYVSLQLNHWRCDCNMRWVKNATELLRQTGSRMVCMEPSKLRGHSLLKVETEDLTCDYSAAAKTQGMFIFTVVLMITGISASLATISLLVYWKRGWVCRRPPRMYTSVQRSGSTITITEEIDNTSEA